MKMFKVVLELDDVLYEVKVWAENATAAIEAARSKTLEHALPKKISEL